MIILLLPPVYEVRRKVIFSVCLSVHPSPVTGSVQQFCSSFCLGEGTPVSGTRSLSTSGPLSFLVVGGTPTPVTGPVESPVPDPGSGEWGYPRQDRGNPSDSTGGYPPDMRGVPPDRTRVPASDMRASEATPRAVTKEDFHVYKTFDEKQGRYCNFRKKIFLVMLNHHASTHCFCSDHRVTSLSTRDVIPIEDNFEGSTVSNIGINILYITLFQYLDRSYLHKNDKLCIILSIKCDCTLSVSFMRHSKLQCLSNIYCWLQYWHIFCYSFYQLSFNISCKYLYVHI